MFKLIIYVYVFEMREAKYYSKNFRNYGYFIQTMGNSDYKLETIEFTDEYNRKWILNNRYYRKNNKLFMVEWKCINGSIEKNGVLNKKNKKE